MPSKIIISSYNEEKNLYAVVEENENNAWLYLCTKKGNTELFTEVIGDVFICNKVELIEQSKLDNYKPQLPPITKEYGHPEAVCTNINVVVWELAWLGNDSILLKKDNKPWALINHGEKRGMCKAIKKNGPWGNSWFEKKYKIIC